jgi:hypothetical protein
LQILKGDFFDNSVKRENIALRIRQLLYRSFLKIITPDTPVKLANEIFANLKEKRMLPLPKWHRKISYRFYRFLTLLHFPLILLRCIYRIILMTSRIRSIR